MDATLIFPALTGAISVLFWALIKEKDRRIEALEKDNEALERKVETLNDQLGKNSESLDRVAATQEQVAGLLASLISTPPPAGPPRSGTA